MSLTLAPKTAAEKAKRILHLKALRSDHLAGLQFLPEGSPEREVARAEIAKLNAEIKALKG